MGGNAKFNGTAADPIVIENLASRELFQDRIAQLIATINSGVRAESGTSLWTKEGEPIESYMAGSTSFLFDPKIPTDQLVKYKRTFGDIDVQVDKDRLSDLIMFLDQTRTLTDINGQNTFYLVGWENKFDTVITIWEDSVTKLNLQVDFEMVGFENGVPTEWSRFSRSSRWDDAQLYIKGFAHKYIFRALTACDLFEAWVQLKTKRVKRMITPIVFSPKGARIKYKFKAWSDDGCVYEEIPMAESELIRSVDGIYRLFFCDPAEPIDLDTLDKMYSYKGVVDLILDHVDPSEYQTIIDGMENLLWGERAQGIYRGDPKNDYTVKLTAYDYLRNSLGSSKLPNYEMIDDYYLRY